MSNFFFFQGFMCVSVCVESERNTLMGENKIAQSSSDIISPPIITSKVRTRSLLFFTIKLHCRLNRRLLIFWSCCTILEKSEVRTMVEIYQKSLTRLLSSELD